MTLRPRQQIGGLRKKTHHFESVAIAKHSDALNGLSDDENPAIVL